jgi:hypothetical protein
MPVTGSSSGIAGRGEAVRQAGGGTGRRDQPEEVGAAGGVGIAHRGDDRVGVARDRRADHAVVRQRPQRGLEAQQAVVLHQPRQATGP